MEHTAVIEGTKGLILLLISAKNLLKPFVMILLSIVKLLLILSGLGDCLSGALPGSFFSLCSRNALDVIYFL